tara:strand:- start:83 stop:307 length:225 start_codon:yes stop_codon:yes gene_type:complete
MTEQQKKDQTGAIEQATIRMEQIVLIDDGTLDTVVMCTACNEPFRGTFQPDSDSDTYEDFVKWFIKEIADDHEC